jgi:23S rRNA (uracil1939-C5)-methyltransferase
MSRRQKRFEQVEIIDLADKGKSIGKKPDGEIVLVDQVVPGDLVDVITTRKKKGIWHTMPTHFHKLSPDRVEAFCDHFGICGGCKWQHLDYKKQLLFKQKNVSDSLSRIGGFTNANVKSILPSPRLTNYRNKMEFSFSNKRWITQKEIQENVEFKDRSALGLHPPKYFDKVVDLKHCHLQEGISNPIRNFIRTYTKKNNYEYYDSIAKKGFMRSVTIRFGEFTGEVMVNFSFHYEDEKIKRLLDELLNEFPQINSINYCINPKYNESTFDLEFIPYFGPGYIRETINHCTYQIGPKSFFQTNSFQAKVMFEKIKEMADQAPTKTIYDLYCGTGSIGLYLATPETSLVGIEEIDEAVQQARVNQSINGIRDASFITGDIKIVLNDTFKEKYTPPDLIIVDPPRMGLHKDVCTSLLEISSPRIIYVSCNPATQARDLKILSEEYTIDYHQPLDMFPHTHHTENISLLIKKFE